MGGEPHVSVAKGRNYSVRFLKLSPSLESPLTLHTSDIPANMLTKHLTGLVQLRSIQAQISRLVDGFAASGSSLSALDEYGSPGALPKQHPNLVTIATLANQLQALCLGERFALTKSLDVSEDSSLCCSH